MGKTNIALSQSNSDKVLCYKAGVYCKVVSQGEVKVTLYGGERATFRLTHCDVRDLRLTNGSMHRI